MTSIREELDSNLDDRAELERLRPEVAAWREAYEQGRRREMGSGNSEREAEALYAARRRWRRSGAFGLRARSRTRAASIHRLSWQAVDDAPVRRLRQRERHQQCSSSSRAWADRALHRFDFRR